MFHSPNVLTILFGTETGNASVLTDSAFFAATSTGIPTRVADMATYNTFRIATERDMLIVTSTHGEGDPPRTASDFVDFLEETESRSAISATPSWRWVTPATRTSAKPANALIAGSPSSVRPD
jgi:sulfite reductase alpha subunit-like flavoprotein